MSVSPGPSNTILIPEGLLQSVGQDVYKYDRRTAGGDENEGPASLFTLQRPNLTAIAHKGLQRRQYSRHASATDVFRRTHSTTFGRVSPTARTSRHGRAASINIATLLRRKRSYRPVSPLSKLGFGRLEGVQRTVSTRLRPIDNVESSRIDLTPTNDALQSDQFPRSWSPTHRLGRISIHSPAEVPIYLRQPSLVPRHDSISVRRLSMDTEQVQAPFPPGPGKNVPSNSASQSRLQDRHSSIRNTFEIAKTRQQKLQRSTIFQWFFQYTIYVLLLAFVYFILIGRPLWGGTVWYVYLLFEYHLTFVGGSAIFIGLAFFYAFGPLATIFEDPAIALESKADMSYEKPYFPPAPFIRIAEDYTTLPGAGTYSDAASTTALLIPCYKSANLLPATLESALKIFPATSIYVLANGNSEVPLDNTEEICTEFGVNHIWVPIGSKIVAQYVGSYVVRRLFKHALLIDDDCLLPPNFPIVVDRLNNKIKCLGYTLTSIGANRSRGTWCQQAQDLEYKLSGLQRSFAGKIGSATFPHGAIVLWDIEFLIKTFKHHPGFSVSEDWFFGHVARILGSRITMSSSVFVETETPSSVFFAARGGARGGFGEMTVFKQRFKRWNFFFVNGCYYNLAYILFSWRLGFWEIGAKLFVFQEVYETILYLITPIVLPISFFVRPAYTAYLFAATLGLYLLNSIIFNEYHLRGAGQMVDRRMLYVYYMPFKLALTCVNVASCWWSLWQYAKYFAKKHPRIVDDVGAVGVVLKIEEEDCDDGKTAMGDIPEDRHTQTRSSLQTLRRFNSQVSGISNQSTESAGSKRKARRLTVTAMAVDTALIDQHANQTGRSGDKHLAGGDTVDNSGTNLSRRRSVSGGVFGQLSDWKPGWRSPTGVRSALDDRVDILEQVDEANDEDELGGYSYYGV